MTAAKKARAMEIYRALLARYPDAHCELNYSNPHELLVATILSAQSTDVGVNKATPALFKAFVTPADFARAEPADIEPYIRTIGLYRNTAKSIVSAMRTIVNDFGGQVPDTMDDLLTLRGVARKTANVVLGNAFHKNEGVVVDTHVDRLSKRLGLVPQDATVPMVERYLMATFPRETWCMLSHLLIFHGRRACKARGGLCATDAICRKWCTNSKG
ncbi:MAG TPA: endonuclease III [Phycisphaerales bacterium]|nr:endonuclease III [Phycisphaerales bacterium]